MSVQWRMGRAKPLILRNSHVGIWAVSKRFPNGVENGVGASGLPRRWGGRQADECGGRNMSRGALRDLAALGAGRCGGRDADRRPARPDDQVAIWYVAHRRPLLRRPGIDARLFLRWFRVAPSGSGGAARAWRQPLRAGASGCPVPEAVAARLLPEIAAHITPGIFVDTGSLWAMGASGGGICGAGMVDDGFGLRIPVGGGRSCCAPAVACCDWTSRNRCKRKAATSYRTRRAALNAVSEA